MSEAGKQARALSKSAPEQRACFRRRMSYIKRRAGLTSRDLSSERAHLRVTRASRGVAL